MSCPVVDLTKILKVITNGNVHPHFGFLINTIKNRKKMRYPVVDLTKYEMTFNGSHKILKVITNGTVRFHFGFLTDTIKINVSNPKKKLLLHSWG